MSYFLIQNINQSGSSLQNSMFLQPQNDISTSLKVIYILKFLIDYSYQIFFSKLAEFVYINIKWNFKFLKSERSSFTISYYQHQHCCNHVSYLPAFSVHKLVQTVYIYLLLTVIFQLLLFLFFFLILDYKYRQSASTTGRAKQCIYISLYIILLFYNNYLIPTNSRPIYSGLLRRQFIS